MESIQQRLKRAREDRGLSLAALEGRIGVRGEVLALIENGAFGELPAGLYGRHAVRAYARAVGLDADEVLEKVEPALREPEDPLDGLARLRGLTRRAKPREVDGGLSSDRRWPARVSIEPPAEAAADWRTVAASAIDSALLLSLILAMAQLTALAAGAPLSEVVAVAAPAWGLMAAVIATLYFVLFAGVRSATPGARLVEAPPDGERGRETDAGSVVRRGLRCAVRESSILVDWLVTRVARCDWPQVPARRGGSLPRVPSITGESAGAVRFQRSR
jgi:transcriptional regulator with XRE-family HTH domain